MKTWKKCKKAYLKARTILCISESDKMLTIGRLSRSCWNGFGEKKISAIVKPEIATMHPDVVGDETGALLWNGWYQLNR
jgi:hypothetical protein